MSTTTTFGELNGPMIGILMKELARRAIARIQVRRMGFTEIHKESYNPERTDDVFTEADREAQEIYFKGLRECTPQFGIIGEEDNLRVPCTHPSCNIYWTIDPVDGTRAFTREQSHGIGTMLALVCNGKVIAALVGDVMTNELFYFRPGSERVHRIYDFSTPKVLEIDGTKTLAEQYLLLRDPAEKYSPASQKLVRQNDLFKSYQIADGSIGTMMARLWKGEVAAAVFRPGTETPWDVSPFLGICQQMGFIFLQALSSNGEWSQIEMTPPTEVRQQGKEVLVIHGSRLEEFSAWTKNNATSL